MVAGAGAKKKKRFSFPTENTLAPYLLRSACVFGKNGSGKSSFVEAIKFYGEFVVESVKNLQEGDSIDVTPFKFDPEYRKKPTELEATFIQGDNLYQYGFAVDAERVWSEWLFVKSNAPGSRQRTLFQREYDADKKVYVWDISRTGVKGEKDVWRKSTRDNALFLSTAIQLKADAFREPFNWIRNFLHVIDSPDRLSHGFTVQQCEEHGRKDEILNLMQSLDVRIKDIKNEVKDFDDEKFNEFADDIGLSASKREEMKKELDGSKIYKTTSYHEGTDGKLVPLSISEESDGSQVVFSLAGPWLDVLRNGYTLFIDELHNSLHPHALKFLVNLFHDPKINTKNAQLIFTSHETSVMAKGFMHQDQLWVIESGADENSILIPLSDFNGRDITNFQKGYTDGRYGGVPKLKELAIGQ